MANNPYVNKVVYDGNTLIDISTTTAVESDVTSGKVFFKSNGTQATGTNSGGGSVQFDSKTATASSYPTTLSFTGLKGEPKMFAVHLTSQVSSSGSTSYYYIVDMIYNGTTLHGNYFRIGSTRRVENVSSGYSFSYSNGTLTLTSSASSRSYSPGAFNNTYELIYVY